MGAAVIRCSQQPQRLGETQKAAPTAQADKDRPKSPPSTSPMMKLSKAGKVLRYDTGIYYIPKKSAFASAAPLSSDKVVEAKYIKNEQGRIGYVSGLMFANMMGLTTQVSTVYDIVTNKATRDYRQTSLGQSTLILRKPKIPVTGRNYKALQFLDLMKDVDALSELSGAQLNKRLVRYMNSAELDFPTLETYLPNYPDRIYKNLYEAGLVHG